MAGLTPLPPFVHHETTRLTHAQAHAQLSAFLEHAENEAGYRPDSTLTERGPQSVSTGANPNLTLHHLKRILQGLEGKRIGGEDVGRFFGDGARAAGLSGLPRGTKRQHNGQDDLSSKQARREMVEDQHPDDEGNDVGIAVARESDDWQDKDEYQLAQREGAAELLEDDKQPGMSNDQPVNQEDAEDMMDVEIERTGKKVLPTASGEVVDKEARKKAKAQRLKDEKKKRNEARAKR